MRVFTQLLLAAALFISLRSGASAACSSAAASAATSYAAYARFEDRLFKHDDPRGAIAAYGAGANAAHAARAASCNDRDVVARVLAVSAALSIVHSTLELNAAPDNARTQCPPEHRNVARSDVANAWVGLAAVRSIRGSPPRYAQIIQNARAVASRLGMSLPSLDASQLTLNNFLARYQFNGSGQCFHNAPP